ncbi:hypothetical protein IWW50_002769, partial [Coemansia erecta]
MAHTTASMQSPVTPSRQLGAARGPRRTPASRSKKPYARPAAASSGESQPSYQSQTAYQSQADYQSQASPGFLKGMRSLVARLWGTSLKPSNAAPERESRPAAPKFNPFPAEMHANKHVPAEPASGSGASSAATFSVASGAAAAAAVAAAAAEETPVGERHAATVGARARARRPTAESVFAPSPFAYNKRLAAATPSVANLRDVQRVKDESPALSRRHSSGRIDPRLARLPSGLQLMTPRNGSADTLRFASPSNARRLLDTLGSIHTPILDARSRTAGGPLPGAGLTRHSSESPIGAERAAPMPLRRLPVSLLALSDTPNKAPRTPLAEPAESLNVSTLRRSSSLRAIPRRQATAPSLARTIQLQQARKAVADRLIRNRTADAQPPSSDASSDVDWQPSPSVAESSDDAVGSVRMREDEEDDTAASKRRRGIDGEAIDVSEDAEMADEEPGESRRRVDRLKRTRRRRLTSRRASSAADAGVKWRFSARFDTAPDEDESSSESDEDREALAAKVPLSKIRGGELIGLSLRPPTSGVSSAASGTVAAVRPTGFGSTRTPVPIVSETEPTAASIPAASSSAAISSTAAAEAKPAAAAASDAVSSTLFGGVTSKPLLETAEPKAEAKKPETDKPAFSFGALTPAAAETDKPAQAETNKPAQAESAAPAPAAASSAPTFNFGSFAAKKPDSGESVAPAASAAPTFSFGTTTTKRSADEAEGPAKDTAAKPATTSFSFGATSAKRSADESDESAKAKPAAPTFSFGKAASPEKPAEPEKATASGFSFGASKPAATTGSADATAKPAFSFGSFGATAAPASSGEAAKPADTPAPAAPGFKFGFGAQSTPAKTDGEKTDTAAISAAKPTFSFGSGTGTSSFGLAAKSDKATPATEAPSTGGFSFGKPAVSSSSGPGTGFSFGGSSSTSFAAPVKTVDLTTSASGASASSAAPGTFSGFGSSAAVPASGSMESSPKPAFSFGSKPAAAAATKPPPFGSLGVNGAAKKPAFSFGSLNTPSAASFESTTVPTPAAPSFGAVTSSAPSFGAPAATPSSFSFGAASSPAATPSTPQFSFGAKPAATAPT